MIKPYYSCTYGDLYKGDCLEVMSWLGQKVDLVLTDPPYGTTACKWDSVIPFEDMWKSLGIVTEKDTPKVLFGSEPFSSLLRCSNLKEFKYDWIWKKSKATGHLNAKKKPLAKHEIISIFQESIKYNPQGLVKLIKPKISKGDRGQKGEGSSGECYGKANKTVEVFYENYPLSIIEFNVEQKPIHPTQKPVALLEYLIKTYSLPQQLVLDFTAGSSSTAIACINNNRKFIMIEKEEKYCEISAKRIEEHINKMWSDL